MSLLAAVHAFLARECGADVADEAVVEYVAETVRAGDAADSWRDLDELLAGLSPDVWACQTADQRENLLAHLWDTVRLPFLCLINIAPVQHSVAQSATYVLTGDLLRLLAAVNDEHRDLRSH